MSISFSCNFCARKYTVADTLAGKKVKCKECGTELGIPVPSRGMAPARSAASRPIPPPHDPYGLDEREEAPSRGLPPARSAASRPPRDLYGLDDEREDAPLPPPKRVGMAPQTSRKRRSSAADNGDQLSRSGISLLIFGIGVFVLPFIGLEWKFVSFMPPALQALIGLLMILGGIFCLMASSIGVVRALVFSIVGGVVGIPALIVLLALILPAFRFGQAGQDPNFVGQHAEVQGMQAPAQPNFPPVDQLNEQMRQQQQQQMQQMQQQRQQQMDQMRQQMDQMRHRPGFGPR